MKGGSTALNLGADPPGQLCLLFRGVLPKKTTYVMESYEAQDTAGKVSKKSNVSAFALNVQSSRISMFVRFRSCNEAFILNKLLSQSIGVLYDAYIILRKRLFPSFKLFVKTPWQARGLLIRRPWITRLNLATTASLYRISNPILSS